MISCAETTRAQARDPPEHPMNQDRTETREYPAVVAWRLHQKAMFRTAYRSLAAHQSQCSNNTQQLDGTLSILVMTDRQLDKQ